MSRPPYIKHWRELQGADDSHYPGSAELHTIGSPFGKHFGFARFGVHHEVLKPGRRTSWPHAESAEDEFIYVLEGAPDVWIDGHLHRLAEGDGIGFKAGDGAAHTFINNTGADVRLLVVGDHDLAGARIHYPLHADRNARMAERGFHWDDVPERELGPHDGLPDAQR